MPSQILKVLQMMLPPANMGKRVFAVFLDLLLVFFLSLFVVGKLWLPVHHADVIVQFKILLETYAQQLQAGQFTEFLNQINNNKPILEMFVSVDRVLFLVTWGYFAMSGLLLHGSSLGKQIFNLKVLKITTLKAPTVSDCILRSGILTFFLFSAWPFFMIFNLCFMAIHPLHRGIHDWFCQTYAVNCDLLDEVAEKIRQAVKEQAESKK
ncbi:MAG: RDD family protein [bacterium]